MKVQEEVFSDAISTHEGKHEQKPFRTGRQSFQYFVMGGKDKAAMTPSRWNFVTEHTAACLEKLGVLL